MEDLVTFNQIFFKKYFDFESRATRREFNFIQLTYFLLTFIFLLLLVPLLLSKSFGLLVVFSIMYLGLFLVSIIPGIALIFRRTRDIGLHPLMGLLAFVPVVSWVYFIYLMVASTDSALSSAE